MPDNKYQGTSAAMYCHTKNALIRRPSDRKCKVVGTDTRTMRRYAYLQYYIKYCFIHLPTPCSSSTSPQLRSTFDVVSWDDFCQMGVPLYCKVLQASIWQTVFV